MRRKTTKFLTSSILIGLAILVPACNLSSAIATPDYDATYSLLSTQVAATLAFTPTPEISPTPSQTPDPFFFTPTPQPTYLLPTAGPRPPYYTLQSGEFPYCIARRFNVDPKELLVINNLSSGLIYAPGLVLTIPQSDRPFPPPRALRPHPTTFTVPEYQMTVYKAACYFGDIEPAAILQYNGLTSPILSMGQTLQIP